MPWSFYWACSLNFHTMFSILSELYIRKIFVLMLNLNFSVAKTVVY